MKYSKECECCGNRVSAYAHQLNEMLVEAFKDLVEYYLEKRKPCNVAEKLNLSHNQINNFQKLQYFDLVIQSPEGWLPSGKGIAFYYGEQLVLTPVATFGKVILPDDHEAWETQNRERVGKFISDILPRHYKKRRDYQAEASPQLQLLPF